MQQQLNQLVNGLVTIGLQTKNRCGCVAYIRLGGYDHVRILISLQLIRLITAYLSGLSIDFHEQFFT